MVLQTSVLGLGKLLPFLNSHCGIYASRISLSDIFLFTAIPFPPTWKIPARDTPDWVEAEHYSVFFRSCSFGFSFNE